ncbi:beta-galactosidase [Chitinophaga pendula]|uniref:glycoside hydrolase family 2 protein n=1 Tax=Chitinophaga TaxID=79328 RepID=UPI000BAFE465|nr:MULTISPECIES: glycoside hydrolase family 2 TIM barrel-domain containing protein [Chitinophaga]ASZ12241.1 beta-galactosidase [Chitinophaga sp. MD30]UCJ04727.1 beta-galactosidase [Chitinophaga pendula]
MKYIFLWITGILTLSTGSNTIAQSRQTMAFNDDWQFRKTAGNDTSWHLVHLPHTWNNIDMQTTKDFYQGEGVYRKQLPPNPTWKHKRIFLRFEGAGSVAQVFLNGQMIGSHKGAYGAFACELTHSLKDSAVNELLVKTNNTARPDVIPINHNLFGVYGGLYRPVSLIVTAPLSFAVNDYAAPGVFIRQQNVSAASADITVTAKVDNKYPHSRQAILQTALCDADGNIVKTVDSSIQILPQGMQVFHQQFQLNTPHLWNGLKDPYLYKVIVRILEHGQVIDEVLRPLGIRHFEIIPGKGLFLNRQQLPLKGVCRHQDWWESGSALTNEQHAADLNIIREMGANAVRLAHYQQSEYLYSKADSIGLVIWAEIPFVNAVSGQETDNAKQQLTELIRQNYHHPSIYVWGLHNEVYDRNPGGFVNTLTAALHNLAKSEDPDRYTVSVNGYGKMERFENRNADIQGMNRYYGWYEGKTTDLEQWITGLKSNFPEYNVILSEYGAEGNIFQQTETPPATFNPVNGQYFPEQLETRFHETQWGILAKHPYLLGSYLWNMFDFAVPLWNRGGIPARNLKGLVTFDRKVKKDAFYWYKANWSDTPVLYISDRRLTQRTAPQTDITVYSNIGQPHLTINGRRITDFKQGTTAVHYIFTQASLRKGQNKVQVKVIHNGKEYTDNVIWTLQ